MANALWAYERYISKTFWPADLSIFYPHPYHWPAGLAIGAALLLALWSGLSIWRARQNPYLLVGWFWFLGTSIPTIGLVQVGSQSMADRYMYIPSIGLFILVVWGVNDFLNWRPHWRRITALAGGVALAGCLVGTEIQLSYWQNSIKLFRHAIEATTDNFVAYTCLGETLRDLGMKKEAMMLCAEAVRISPNSPVAQYNFGMALLQNDRLDEALAHLDAAGRLAPHNSEIQYNLGLFLLLHNKPDEAARLFHRRPRRKTGFCRGALPAGAGFIQTTKIKGSHFPLPRGIASQAGFCRRAERPGVDSCHRPRFRTPFRYRSHSTRPTRLRPDPK